MTEEKELRLYEFNLGGERYWIAAYDTYGAVDVLRTVEPDGDETVEEFCVERAHEERASTQKFTDDDGSKRSIWAQFLTETAPGVVATTLF